VSLPAMSDACMAIRTRCPEPKAGDVKGHLPWHSAGA
jgi:hypothetical protein